MEPPPYPMSGDVYSLWIQVHYTPVPNNHYSTTADLPVTLTLMLTVASELETPNTLALVIGPDGFVSWEVPTHRSTYVARIPESPIYAHELPMFMGLLPTAPNDSIEWVINALECLRVVFVDIQPVGASFESAIQNAARIAVWQRSYAEEHGYAVTPYEAGPRELPASAYIDRRSTMSLPDDTPPMSPLFLPEL